MRTIVKELCGKERVLKLQSRQKAMYEDLTGKALISEDLPTFKEQATLLRCALSFSDKKITQDQVYDIVDEIGDTEFYKLIGEIYEAIGDEMEGIENAIPTK